MHRATLLSTLALLAASANAAALKRQDLHIADFRTWGERGCGEENQGIWTFTESQLTGCRSFLAVGGVNVQSLSLVDIADGHSLIVYSDDSCSEEGVLVSVGQCHSPEIGPRSFLLL